MGHELDWLTMDIWKQWDKSGRITFTKMCERMMEENFEGSKDEEFSRAIYELVITACRGGLGKEKIPLVMHDLVTINSSAASTVADTLSLIDQETSPSCSDDGVARDVFCYIVRNCEGLLGHVLQERLDVETLPEAGVISNGRIFNTRFIRVKTKLYYKQQKFNLLREESEGYAKLISELSQPLYLCSPNYIVQVVQCLIGRFNLDPNRVVDLVIEAFECQPDCNFFISLLKKLRPSSSTICELTGFKVTNCEEPCWSLFVVVAYLIQHGIIKLEDIYPWLTPGDGAIQKDWERELKDAKEYARKSMIVTINKEAVDDQDTLVPPEDRYEDNQKFILCEALLAVGDWDHASIMMQRLPDFTFVSKKAIALQLSNLVHYLIDPLYMKITSSRSKYRDVGGPLDSSCNTLIPPQIHNYEELYKNIHIFLALGPYIHYDPVLLSKLLRLMKYFLHRSKNESQLYYTFITVFEEVVLPGLNFLDVNCCVSEEIWTVLKYYPYHHRYRLYGAWKGESIVLLHPSLLRKRVDLVQKIKHLMRRISKENVKPMGRLLGKLAHSMPGVIFDYVLSQIQLFDNLITPVIDALKFLTSLSYDVLGFCLLEALSPSSNTNTNGLSLMLMPNRPRTKHDGSTIAPWLQSLSSFAGSICKKYSLELVPLLQYVANQLKTRQSLDLLLLKEIVQKMAGIEAMEEITEEQLDAMAGGELLRAEAGSFGQIRIAKKSASRLRESSAVNDLAVTLCILMAQQRNGIIYDEAQSLHTKLVGKLYDQCQDTLVQFGSFLATSYTLDDYAKKIPPLQNLVEDYHVSSDVAFFLWRPLFSYEISARYDNLRREEKNHKNLTPLQRRLKYAEAANSVLNPVADMMRNHLSAKTWEDISPQFYVTFWSLTLSDLFVPSEAYAREINRVKQMSIGFGDNKEMASNKRKKEQDRCSAVIEKLQDEERRQLEHVDRVKAKLSKEKDTWFASRSAKSAKNEAVTAFLQLCLFPRCIFTAPDALYCAHFVHTIHSLSTPNFSTLICYDRIFCDIIYAVTSCTENEANRYGQFLCALLGTVMKWHSDKTIFNKECASFPGFVTKFRATTTGLAESNDHVDYENYRHVCHKWHYKITKCVIVCLESNDVTQIRNALIVLRRILPHYPRVLNLASAVERWIERVRGEQKDKRQDLFALATSYIGQLKTRWPTLVAEEDFHQKSPPEKPATDVKTPKPAGSTDTKVIKQVKANDSSKIVKPGDMKTNIKVVVPGAGTKDEKGSTAIKEKKRIILTKTVVNDQTGLVAGSNNIGNIKNKKVINGTANPSTATNTSTGSSLSTVKQILESVTVTKSAATVTQASVRSVTIKEEPKVLEPLQKEMSVEKTIIKRNRSDELRSDSAINISSIKLEPASSRDENDSSTIGSTILSHRRTIDSEDSSREVKRRKLDSAKEEQLLGKERSHKMKRDKSEGHGESSSINGNVSSSRDQFPTMSTTSSGITVSLVSSSSTFDEKLSRDRSEKKKRDKKRSERKREREDFTHPSSSSKRGRSDDSRASSQRSPRMQSSSNGEWIDRLSPKEKDRSPRQSSRERDRSSMKHSKSNIPRHSN